MLTRLIDCGRQYFAAFERVAREVPPQHAAILPSEMFAFVALCWDQGVTVVVESGRRYGYSTEVLCRCGFEVVSCETDPDPYSDERLAGFGNLKMVREPGERALPLLLDENRNKKTAVLLDGPKGLTAFGLYRELQDRAVLWGIHDCYPGTPVRTKVIENGGCCTDAPCWIASVGGLDEQSLRYRGYKTHGDLLTVGNVLGLLPGGRWIERASGAAE